MQNQRKMNFDNTDDNTGLMNRSVADLLGKTKTHFFLPRLFVCFEHEVMEFVLEGRQTLGRPAENHVPDIPVTNKYVSRKHGYFETKDGKVTYTAEKTLNGIIFRRRLLKPGETVELWDGDELIIPIARDEGVDVMLVCAITESRINIWRDLELAARDNLTGLSGRNTFRTWYIQNHSYKSHEKVSLFILDIDYFKEINDHYGHAEGDKALKLLAEELRVMAGSKGFVCRWGGDEFVGILSGDVKEAQKSLNTMRNRIDRKNRENLFRLTVSAGIITVDREMDIDEMVGRADRALYKAKELGRNRVEVYSGGQR